MDHTHRCVGQEETQVDERDRIEKDRRKRRATIAILLLLFNGERCNMDEMRFLPFFLLVSIILNVFESFSSPVPFMHSIHERPLRFMSLSPRNLSDRDESADTA